MDKDNRILIADSKGHSFPIEEPDQDHFPDGGVPLPLIIILLFLLIVGICGTSGIDTDTDKDSDNGAARTMFEEVFDSDHSGNSDSALISQLQDIIDFGPSLKEDTTGDSVAALQTALNRLGYDCGAIDGTFGSATDSQVRQFQQDHGLAVDGCAGHETLTAMIEALG